VLGGGPSRTFLQCQKCPDGQGRSQEKLLGGVIKI
jgi:hypothetical protein